MSLYALSNNPYPYLQTVVPPEIRVLIFQYLLVGQNNCMLSPDVYYEFYVDHSVTRPAGWFPLPDSPYEHELQVGQPPRKNSLHPQILATCRRFYQEGYAILYKQNIFAPIWSDAQIDLPQQSGLFNVNQLSLITNLIFINAYLASEFSLSTNTYDSLPNIKTVTLILDNYNAFEDMRNLDLADNEDSSSNPPPWDNDLPGIIDRLREPISNLARFEVRFEKRICDCRSEVLYGDQPLTFQNLATMIAWNSE
ncbi:hypothetical protein BT63DRAFT_412232 [Microthyrium microscopicum]|uniref:Uncharacterized protein n=1 Tax=Microthyrium microscopicum TaxID=703497 RepID=A0A6A6UH82_9PEZI|nr:hypothetical protein BT63DRAFT_412232 [Microthyrium microscopicum]